ncbi:MAG: hypothetical protein Q4G60_09070 [bacterium]|nr:hypothetical protein [bacterium]
MKNQSSMDMQISHALHNKSDGISASEDLKRRIDEQLDRCDDGLKIVDITSSSAYQDKERTMKKLSKGWIAAAAAALCVLVPTGVYAAGQITGYVSSISFGHDYGSYAELDQAKKDLGFDFQSVESFSNGYTIQHMESSDTDKMDDEGNRFGTFSEWWGTYTKEGDEKLSLIIHEVQPEAAAYPDDSMEQREINGVTVSYKQDHYKFVPEDYELTAEDEANMAAEHYYISYGSEEIEENDIKFASWQKDGIYYSFMYSGSIMGAEDFFKMAEEILQQ